MGQGVVKTLFSGKRNLLFFVKRLLFFVKRRLFFGSQVVMGRSSHGDRYLGIGACFHYSVFAMFLIVS